MTVPLWRIQIQKQLGMEDWANDYLSDDATIEDAQDLANQLISFERAIHQTTVLFMYVRISSFVKHDRFFRHIALNLAGLDTAGDSLPLYCTARLDLPTANADPCRKYYRLPVSEAAQTNGVINGSVLSSLNGVAGSMLVTPGVIDHIVSNAGHKVIGASFAPMVQMRQLRHRKKKKVV